jgi:hypothetical protein
MLIITDSTAAKETNETSNSYNYNHHHRKIGSHNFMMKGGTKQKMDGSDTPNEQGSK